MQLFVAACVITWAVALISLCGRRDIEIHDKLTWVVTVLVLNALGALIYFIFGPRRQAIAKPQIDADAIPVTPEGTSWNPILGENRMAGGEGLNPKVPKSTESEE